MTNRQPPAHYNPPPMFGLRQPEDWPGALIGYYSPGPDSFGGRFTFIATDDFASDETPLLAQTGWSRPHDVDFRDFAIQSTRSLNHAIPYLPLVVLPDGSVAQFPTGLKEGDEIEMRSNGQVLINGVEVTHNLSAPPDEDEHV